MCVYIFQGQTLCSQYLAHTTELHAPRDSVVKERACPVSGMWHALPRAPQELHIANLASDNEGKVSVQIMINLQYKGMQVKVS